MSEIKKQGRPLTAEGQKIVVGVRFPEDTINKLDSIVQAEKKRTGYNDIDRSNVIRKAVDDFIQRYVSGAE